MSFVLKHYEKIKLIVLLLLVASLPFYLKISNVLIGLGAFLTVFRAIATKRPDILKPDKLSLAFICFFFLEVVGLLYTEKENLAVGFFTLDKHQGFILVPLLFSDIALSRESREKLLLTFTGSCFVGAVICIAVNMHESITLYDRLFHEWLFSHDRVSGPIGMQAVYFAMYLSLSVLIILNFVRHNHQRSLVKTMLLAILTIFLLVVIVALGARTATVGLIMIIFLNLMILARQQRSYKIYVLAALVPVLFAAFIFLNPVVKTRFMDIFKSSYEGSNYGSYFARTHIWVPGIEAISENLVAGVGTGDHQKVLNEKYVKHGYSEGVRNDFNMHSQYLQTLLNFGIIGLAALLLLFYIQIKPGLRKMDLLYLSFITLFMIACITEAMLVVNKGTMFLLVFSFIFFKSKNSP